MQGRGGKKQLLFLLQQSTVRCEDHFETLGLGQLQKPAQFWVAQRLPQNVKVEIVCVWPKPG